MNVFLSSDNVVEITDVRDRLTGSPIAGATVAATLIDPADPNSVLASLTLSDEGSGLYLGYLSDDVTAALDESVTYRLTVTTTAAGRQVVKRVDLRPRWAGAND